MKFHVIDVNVTTALNSVPAPEGVALLAVGEESQQPLYLLLSRTGVDRNVVDPRLEGRVEELVPLAAHVEDEAAAEEEVLQAEAGAQFNRKMFGLNFGLKNSLRLRFDYATCLNYPFFNIFLVWGISSQNSSDFSSQNSSQNFSIELGSRLG